MLRTHDAIGAPVGLARDDGELGDGGFGEGVEQLGAVADNAAVLLLDAGHEAGDVFEGDERNVERIAETHEACGLDAGVDVENASEKCRLVRDDPHSPAGHAREADDEIAREVFMDLKEISPASLVLIDHARDDVDHVVGLVRLCGNDRVECSIGASRVVGKCTPRCVIEVVRRQKA